MISKNNTKNATGHVDIFKESSITSEQKDLRSIKYFKVKQNSNDGGLFGYSNIV